MQTDFIYDGNPHLVHPAHFTGKERDSESELDYFGARYYSSTMGRFMSPDWADSPSPVPWAVFSDPQSLNLYSYVRNNPLSHRDLDGHVKCSDGTEADACVTAKPYDPITSIVLTGAFRAINQSEKAKQAIQSTRPVQWLNKKLDPKSVERAQWAILLGSFLARDLGLASDEITDVTTPGSVENADVKLTPDQMGAKLQDNGFTKSAASDGTPTYVKGDTQYTVYSNAKSTGGPTAQVKENGSVVGKVRLK